MSVPSRETLSECDTYENAATFPVTLSVTGSPGVGDGEGPGGFVPPSPSELLLPHAPAQVILSACSTAGAPERAGPESASLAYAFVLSGAREVIAATRPIQDDDAARLSGALHRELAHTDAASALRNLQLESPEASAFRVIVP